MHTTWIKALRGALAERGRAVVAIAAIALGLAGFFAVLATYAILERELNAGYLASNPASAILVTDHIDDSMLAAVEARADVDVAEARRLLRGRIRTAGAGWQRLALFILKDPDHTRLSTITREQGRPPVRAGDLLIERDAFQVAQARVGDRVEIELRDRPAAMLRVAGGVHDVGQAQARMENTVYAYVTPETLPLLGETPTLDSLHLLVSGARGDETHVRRVADDVRAWLERNGHPVTRVIVPTPGEHPHAAIMGLLLLSISVFGLVILGLSAVIVCTVMLSALARQRRHIAMMKAIGGTRGQITAIYLAQAALLGVAACVVGIGGGLAGSRALTIYLARLLNFDVTSWAIPLWVFLLVVLVGIAVPLLAAAYPVATITAITIREALAERAAPVRTTHRGTEALRTTIRHLGASVPLCVATTRPARAALPLVTMTIAGAAFMAAITVRTSLMAKLDALFGAGTFGSADRYAIDQHMLMIYAFLLIAAGLLTVIGSLGLMAATSLNVLDRRRELGVLRTIGASPGTIAGLIVSESVVVVLISWLLALATAWPLSVGLGRALRTVFFRSGLDITFSLPGVGIWLLVSATVSVASSIVPAVRASRRPIREAISYE